MATSSTTSSSAPIIVINDIPWIILRGWNENVSIVEEAEISHKYLKSGDNKILTTYDFRLSI